MHIVIVCKNDVVLSIEHFDNDLAADKFIAIMTLNGYDVTDYKEA